MASKQTQNGVGILREVLRIANAKGWDTQRARTVGRMAIMCAMAESNLWVYANRNNPESLALPHDQVGSDHASVGLFQQQVPSWGTTADCMDVAKSTDKFVNALSNRGLDTTKGPAIWQRIQSVQVSAFPDGSNYRKQRTSSLLFLWRHWPYGIRKVR